MVSLVRIRVNPASDRLDVNLEARSLCYWPTSQTEIRGLKSGYIVNIAGS
jgi:hypothetical protein